MQQCILLHCAGNSYALAFVPSAYPAKCNRLQGWILLHCAVNPFIPALLQQNPGCIPNTKPAKCNRLHQTRRHDLPAKCNNLQQVFNHWCILLHLAGLGLKRCQGCVKLIASKVNCFLNINDLSEVQLCMSPNSWTWECPHTKDGADHVPLIFLSSVHNILILKYGCIYWHFITSVYAGPNFIEPLSKPIFLLTVRFPFHSAANR